MNKKLISMALLVCSIPVAANASWTFNTWAKSAGGTITSRNGVQTSVNGSTFKSYTTHAALTPATVVTAAAGYTISSVTVNGVSTANPASPYTAGPISGGLLATTAQSVYASFKAALLTVGATTDGNGSVSPASVAGIYYGKTVSPLVFTFQPKSGYYLNTLTGATGFTVSAAIPAAVNQAVKVTIPAGTTLTGAVALAGTFTTANVLPPSAGANQAVAFGKLVTLTGTNGPAAWTQVSGPAVTLTGTNPVTFTSGLVNADYVFAYGASQVKVTTNMDNAALTTCVNCHNQNGIGQAQASYSSNHVQYPAKNNVYNAWTASNHKTAGVICYDCHNGANNGGHPGTVSANTCTPCHGTNTPSLTDANAAHAGATTTVGDGCIECHSTGQNAGAGFVQDNSGVRSITQEFAKWSHHVTGVSLQNAHCAACHLEGKAQGGVIVTDPAYHMADAKIHLRNADTNADIQWDPAAPSFSNMDNFCLSCHDANGATGIAGIQALMVAAAGKTASATNPFGDTISNQYDLLERPAVVDAKSQFATGNPSHHAVLGKKYSGRTRVSGSRQIADVAAFTNNSGAGTGAERGVTLPGARSTIYDAGKFTAAYTTLADAAGETGARNGGTTLGDDSTLHCGDCHTVGQYRAADVNVLPFNKAVIGAHGSANEYLLRNNVGTDARHQGADVTGPAAVGVGTKPYPVCFNCHAFETYGSIGASTGAAGFNHAGEYANTTRCNGPDNTIFGNMTGEGRLRSMNTITTATGATGYGKPAGALYGNVFGIQCNNCHNSGVTAGNIFGGIHGSADQTYTDGMGNTTKHNRFMPGFANIMYVPGTKGGVSNGTGTALYNSYSGNRNGTGSGLTTGQTFTTLPYRTIVPGITAANITLKDNGKSIANQPSYATSAATLTKGSYQFTTGGTSNDLNWEQKSQQPIAGEFDYQAKSMGCYTLSNQATPAVTTTGSLQPNGTTTQSHVTVGIQAGAAGPDGTNNVFDNWGGCDDHGSNQGAGTGTFRKVLRKTSY